MPSLTRSKSSGTFCLSEEIKAKPPATRQLGPRILKSITNADLEARKTLIEEAFRVRYKLEPRLLQVECVLLLLGGWNTFLLASTGFGKSKVPEMYLDTYSKNDKPMILVLNPLDALGDNQVISILGYSCGGLVD